MNNRVRICKCIILRVVKNIEILLIRLKKDSSNVLLELYSEKITITEIVLLNIL